MDNQRVVKVLGYLYRITAAGERGYAVAATNVSNRALKVLFRSYAQQRAGFKDEILAEIQRLGGQPGPSRGFLDLLGMIHRGRIDIFAALTIGAENVEKVVLKEVMVGERVALAAYEKVLKQDFPSETQQLVARHYEEIREIVERIDFMRGQDGKRLVVHLYDSKADAARAYRFLKEAGVSEQAIETEELHHIDKIELHRPRNATILETVLSGAVGGAIWGAVAGGLAFIGILQIAGITLEPIAPRTVQLVAVLSALGLITGGTFIGSMIGFFIGLGISSEDRYLYEDSVEYGHVLVWATVDRPRASWVWQMMNRIEIQSRSRRPSEISA